jgi:ABC-type transport system involved in multi-copper enzyme maturation permease subunit
MTIPLRNPLLVKELREEMRSRKILVVVPVYIALLSIVALISVSNNSGTSFNPAALAINARTTLYIFVVSISVLLGLIAIVLGASSVTGEKERATYELLELTPLTNTQLMIGKFLHIIIFIGLVLLSSLPVLSTLFFMGGLSFTDLLFSFLYLVVFLAVVTLASLCASIAVPRTIASIMICLGLSFVVSLVISIFSGSVYNKPDLLGFALFSPWLIAAKQIFQPSPLKLLGHDFPLWPFYLFFYACAAMLFVIWGRNSLDTRKLERNPWARIVGLLLLNFYLAVGLLCMRSYAPIHAIHVTQLFDYILVFLFIVLPCFGMGILTERDQVRFEKHPMLESFHPRKLLWNYPATGMAYLILMLLTFVINVWICTGLPWSKIMTAATPTFIWAFPWLMLFSALRLAGLKQRGILQTYLLATVFYVIVSAFDRGGSKDLRAFLILPSTILVFASIALITYLIVRRRLKRVSYGPL